MKWFILHVVSESELEVYRAVMELIPSSRVISEVRFPVEVLKEESKSEPQIRKRFPGYLFLKCEEQEGVPTDTVWSILRTIPGVVGLVGWKKPFILSEETVEQLLISNDMNVPSETFQVGDPVLITSGPFKDTPGFVKLASNRSKLVVQAVIFGREVEISCEPEILEKLEKSQEVKEVSSVP